MNVSAIDLFCGIGGLSYGLKKAGIPVIAGFDIDPTCQYAFETNVQADFKDIDVGELKGSQLVQDYWSSSRTIRVLAGCAPCQPFSTHANKVKNRQQTKRWRLISEFARLVEETTPDIVTMENVPNLSNQVVFRRFVERLIARGYHVSYSNVYCPDYGIPQKRRRLVLLASRYGDIELPPATHSPGEYVSVKAAIGHLPRIGAGEEHPKDPLHRTMSLSEINKKRIKASRPNGTWLDWKPDLRLNCHRKGSGKTYKAVYGRMAWDEPSSTITTQFYNYGTGRFGHPEQDRALTLREAALLQTFPQNYRFCKDEKAIAIKKLSVQIGNAVPVALGAVIGKAIRKHLEKHNGRAK